MFRVLLIEGRNSTHRYPSIHVSRFSSLVMTDSSYDDHAENDISSALCGSDRGPRALQTSRPDLAFPKSYHGTLLFAQARATITLVSNICIYGLRREGIPIEESQDVRTLPHCCC